MPPTPAPQIPSAEPKSWEPAPRERFLHYELVAPIGAGSSSVVWLARNENLTLPVAVKILKRSNVNRSFADQFLREARLMATFNHPGMIRIFNCGEWGGRLFIEMELLDGLTLGQLVRRFGRLSDVAAVEAIIGTAMILHVGWQRGLVHRDLKPDNIMATVMGEAKLMDFGLSEVVKPAPGKTAREESTTKRLSQLSGSPPYMAPELLYGDTEPGPATDIYALGISLFQLITGRYPYYGSTAAETLRLHVTEPIPNISDVVPCMKGLDAIVRRMLSKTPTNRYTDYRMLVADLMDVLKQSGKTSLIEDWSQGLRSQELGNYVMKGITEKKFGTSF